MPAPADAGSTRAKRGSPVTVAPVKRHRKRPPSSPTGGLKGPSPAATADFFIDGTQGHLEVCESRSILVDGVQRNYLLVRLRGQSNTLPNDASLTVRFGSKRPERKLALKFCRVRLKARELKFDYLPEPTQLDARSSDDSVFKANLIASIFSKKCWQGMVVRGPRMFVAYITDGVRCNSVPMFVEISPTANSPEYRDPVLEYSEDVIRLFFGANTIDQIFAQE